MLVESGRLLHLYERKHLLLGRHMELDSKSLAYTVEKIGKPIAIRPITHAPAIPILDQSNLHAQGIHVEGDPDSLGSCVGNATTAALSALVGSAGLAKLQLDGLTLSATDSAANERFAITAYHEATVADGFPGDWPPSDTGSSGLGSCKAMKKAGLIGSYAWATTLRGIAMLLQRGGVLIGMPWLQNFFEPDSHGFIDSAADWGGVAGGHEVFICGLVAWDDRDPSKVVFDVVNSWGKGFGKDGHFYMRGSTYEKLKQQIDCKGLIARTA